MELTPEQQEKHDKFGFEYNEYGFSQVRTNMMKDRYYTPYCIPCPGIQRFGQLGPDDQMTCSKCGDKTTFPKEFIERFKAKHNIESK